MNKKEKRRKTTLTVLGMVLCLLFTGCLFGGNETQNAQESGNTQTPAASAEEPSAQAPAGPVTKEMTEADLTEAIAALTGQEGAGKAHLLDALGEPLEDFAYEGGAAIVAQHIHMEVKSVTGKGDQAQAVFSITSPNLYPLIGEASRGMKEPDEEKMTENLNALLQAGSYAETTYEVTVGLQRIDGVWYIEQNEELQNALAGGLYEVEKSFEPKEGGKGQ